MKYGLALLSSSLVVLQPISAWGWDWSSTASSHAEWQDVDDREIARAVCPSTPLLQALPRLVTCRAEVSLHLPQGSPKSAYLDSPSAQTGKPSNSTKAPVSAEVPASEWTGGRRCVGDYCLYTNRGFAGGRGIVLITNHANADQVKAIEKRLLEYSQEGSELPFHIAEVDGKGLGMVANRTLQRGDTVMIQTPVLLAHRSFIERLPQDQKEPILDLVPGLLPAATRRAFTRQAGTFGGHKISDILTTNSFQMDVTGAGPQGDGLHYGNFPEVSRYNHDCRPNVAFFIDENLTHHTTVVRPVKPGEELTISYLDPMGPRSARQHRARLAWGFDCSCSQCSLPDTAAAASDDRLQEISELETRLSDVKDADVSVKTVERYLKLLAQERLQSKMAGPYTTVALNYNLLGRDSLAVKHAKLAIEAGLIESGPRAPDVEAMRVLARDPKKHFTWRGRLRK